MRRTARSWLALSLVGSAALASACGDRASGEGRAVPLDTLAGFQLGMSAQELHGELDRRGRQLECAGEGGEVRVCRAGEESQLLLEEGRLVGIRREISEDISFAEVRGRLEEHGAPRREEYSPGGARRYSAQWESEQTLFGLICPDTVTALGCEVWTYVAPEG